MAQEQALVSIGADLSALRRELASIPNQSAKELQKLLISVERTAQKAEKAAKESVKRASKESEAAARDAIKAQNELNKERTEGAKGLAEFLGFDVGPLEKLNEASKLTSTSMGAVAVGAAAGAAAVAGLGFAVYSAVSKALELKEGLEQLAKAAIVPPLDPALGESLGQAEDSMAALEVATNLLVYEVGGTLAPAVTAAALGLVGLIETAKETYNAFNGLGGVLKTVGAIWMQNLIDFMLLGASTMARFVGVVGDVASALGAEGVGAALKDASSEFLEFKNGLGAAIATTAIDNWQAGLNGMITATGHAADKHKGLKERIDKATEAADKNGTAVGKQASELKKLAEEAARATDRLKDIASSGDEMAKLTRDYEKLQAEIKAAGEVAKDAALTEAALKAASIQFEHDKLDLIKKQNEEARKQAEELRQFAQEAEQAVQSLESMAGILSPQGLVTKGLVVISKGIMSISKGLLEASGAGDLLAAMTNPVEAINLAADAVKAGQEASAALKEAKAGLAEAEASGDAEAIAEAQAKVEQAKKALQEASPANFIKGLVSGAKDMVTGIVDALPALLEALTDAVPGLIDTVIEAIPVVIQALAEKLPEIIQILAKAIPELVAAIVDSIPFIVGALIQSVPALIQGLISGLPTLVQALVSLAPKLVVQIVSSLVKVLFQSVPQLVLALFEALRGAFIKVKNVIRDVFKEAVTFGKADTKTFGDTPGPVKVGIDGLRAKFSAGDIVVAAKDEAGIMSQMGASSQVQPKQETKAVLELRDGLVFIDKALRQNINRGGVAFQSGKKR